jgi:hypothetical protein
MGALNKNSGTALVPPTLPLDAVGLLHPIVIRPDGTLIAGECRLRALLTGRAA